jgi:hypothetical protein
MKNRALFLLLGVAVAVAACDGTLARVFGSGPTPSKVCNKGGQCHLNVTVTGCAAGGSQISVDHEVVGMKKDDNDIDIHWKLAGNQYEFPAQAIQFTSREFDQPDGNKNNYKVRDRNTKGSGTSPHKYSITVVKAGGAPCATKDPIIINDY